MKVAEGGVRGGKKPNQNPLHPKITKHGEDKGGEKKQGYKFQKACSKTLHSIPAHSNPFPAVIAPLGQGLHPDLPFSPGLSTEFLAKDSYLLPLVQNHLLSQKKSFPPAHF